MIGRDRVFTFLHELELKRLIMINLVNGLIIWMLLTKGIGQWMNFIKWKKKKWEI